jgi:hypothetical protein
LQLIAKRVTEQLSDILSAEVSVGLRKKNKRNFIRFTASAYKTGVSIPPCK